VLYCYFKFCFPFLPFSLTFCSFVSSLSPFLFHSFVLLSSFISKLFYVLDISFVVFSFLKPCDARPLFKLALRLRTASAISSKK